MVGRTSRPHARAAHLGPQRRRPQVIDAARDLAAEGGISAVTMTAVARRMDVSKPVVYACFASREELLETLLEREQETLLVGVLAALPTAPRFEDPEKVMIEGFTGLLKVVEEHPASWRIVFTDFPDPDVSQRFQDAKEIVAERAGEVMRPMLAENGMTDVERKLPLLVEFFMGACESAVKSLLNSDGRWTTEELGEFFGRLLYSAYRHA